VGATRIHMPPFTSDKNSYINYFLLGSGLPGDDTPTANTSEGGYQGWQGGMPDVETTYHALILDSDRWSLTHEFFHALQNSYGTINGNTVSWIHESHNDYMVIRLVEHEGGATPGQSAQFELPGNVSYLDSLVYDQPYVPIESCGIGPPPFLRTQMSC
jgi:hypothetical protein